MARIPDFTALGNTPSPQAPLSVARIDVTPLEFTVRQGPGEAMIRGGQQIASAGIQMQDHIDTLKAEDAYNQLIQKRTQLEVSPENGFANVKGSAAIDRKFYDDYNRRFNDAAAGIEDTLQTPNQKQLFKNRAAVAAAQYQSSLLTHMSQQTSAFADNTEKATVQLEVNNASNMPMTEAGQRDFDTSMTRIRGVIDARGARLHQPPAQIEEAKAEAVSSAWTERIKVLATTDPLAADKMYREHATEIAPASKVALEHQIKQLVTPIQAKNLAMSIIAGTNVDAIAQAVTVGGDNALNNVIVQRERIDEGLPRTKVDTKANLYQWIADAETAANRVKPNDPVFRDLVVQQVKGYVGTLVAAQDGISRAAHSLLVSATMGDEKGQNKPMVLDQLLTTPALNAAWGVTTAEQQRGILAILEHNAREASGVPIKVNRFVVEDAFNRIHAPVDDSRRIVSPTQLAPLFTKGLNIEYYNFLKKELAAQETEEGRSLTKAREDFLHGVKTQFDRSTMFNIDEGGGERFNNFRTYVLQKEAEAIKKGTAHSLYVYNSPDYIGKDIPGFQATLDQQLKNVTDRLRKQAPTPAPTQKTSPDLQRREGETIDDWQQRMRK